MPAQFVAMSDLHFGYDNSVLNDLSAQEHLAEAIGKLCGGATKRLVLCGDAFEGCVPKDAGTLNDHGFSPAVSQASTSFFSTLTKHVDVGELVIVWGNHDYSMWTRLANLCFGAVCKVPPSFFITIKEAANQLLGSQTFVDSIIGPQAALKIAKISCGYPNFVLGNRWPYVVFHHGHLLDSLVLGQDDDVKYNALASIIRTGRPDVNMDEIESIAELAAKTKAFVTGMWEYSNRTRQIEWNLIRRSSGAQNCPSLPAEPGTWSDLGDETPEKALGQHLQWYARLLQIDSTTPAPIGGAAWPSYLFMGHDHGGGRTEVEGYDGRKWKIVNLGGWTNDAGRSPTPHAHVAVWQSTRDGSGPAMEPEITCVRF
jgi:hypothetical protein